MIRQRLIWFAAGAATSGLAAIFGMAMRAEPEQAQWNFWIAEGTVSLADGRDSATWRGGEIARNCGAQVMEFVPSIGADSEDLTFIPLVRDNNPSLGCIVQQAKEAEMNFGVELD